MAVTPYWELHILPMFRLIDHNHMTSFFNLLDYDAVVTNKDDINDALSANSMPPASTGGPWPEEWIALFKRWTDAGCPRLTSAKGVTYALTAKGAGMSLVAQGTYGTNDGAWFERLPDAGGMRVYSLAVRPGGGSGTRPFKVEERSIPKGTASVTAIDGDGSHTVKA
jgi:hypothetical protein